MPDTSRPAVIAVVAYRDPIAAMSWLAKAFGFETTTLITDAEGKVAYAEMAFEGWPLQVMGEWESDVLLGRARVRSPLSTDGVVTHFFRISVRDLDAHCERAKAAGARITQEPKDQFYGDRTYRALDLEGHVWNFAQPVEQVSSEEIERRANLTIRKAPGQAD